MCHPKQTSHPGKPTSMLKTPLVSLIFSLVLMSAYSTAITPAEKVESAATKGSAIPVTLEKIDGKYQIYREGKPYFIRGGGGGGNLELLVSSGGNSLRTWSTE